MPTATTLSGYSLINIGPLTTTFTAPASCSTAGSRTEIAPAEYPGNALWGATCPWESPPECDQNPDAIRSINSFENSGNPAAVQLLVYNSPGIVCPAGYATVAQVERVNPTSILVSGSFNDSMPLPTGKPNPFFFEPQQEAFMAALDPGETAVMCCPSLYTATKGYCYSTIPPSVFKPTAACYNYLAAGDITAISGTYTFAKQTVTGNLESITGTKPVSTVTTTLDRTKVTDYVGVAVGRAYLLVHQEKDVKGEARSGRQARVGALVCLALSLGVLLSF